MKKEINSYLTFQTSGTKQRINIPGIVKEVKMLNLSTLTGNTTSYEFLWMNGIDFGNAIETKKDGASGNALSSQLGARPLWVRTLRGEMRSALFNYNIYSAAKQPVITTPVGIVRDLIDGDVVRLSSQNNATALCGIDFEIDKVNNSANTFRIAEPLSQSVGAAAGPGKYERVYVNSWFYPSDRYIVNITRGKTTNLHLSVGCKYKKGQELKVYTSNRNKMLEINGKTGTVLDISSDKRTVSLDIDSSGFMQFEFPVDNAPVSYTPAYVVPAGTDTAESIKTHTDPSSGATRATLTRDNVPISEITFEVGANKKPGGTAGDKILLKATSVVEQG